MSSVTENTNRIALIVALGLAAGACSGFRASNLTYDAASDATMDSGFPGTGTDAARLPDATAADSADVASPARDGGSDGGAPPPTGDGPRPSEGPTPPDGRQPAPDAPPPSSDAPPLSQPDGGPAPPMKLPQGSDCSNGSQCASTHCVDGFCCESACTATCTACSAAHTGQANGTCRPARDGTDPHNNCSPTDPSTCGNDGECNGAGSCRRHRSGTSCAAATCINNAAAVPPRGCDGQGMCTPRGAIDCGMFACAGGQCRTTCSAHAHCATSSYCDGGTCLAKKPVGSICGAADECGSGFCATKCCREACACPVVSQSNTVANAGLATNLGGWTLFQDPRVSWDADDATGCPVSGSVRISIPAGNDVEDVFTQCVSVRPSTSYNWGIRIRITPPAGSGTYSVGYCRLTWTDSPNCQGQPFAGAMMESVNGVGGWQSIARDNVVSPSEAVSAQFTCSVQTGPPMDAYFDMAYLTPAPGRF